MTVQDQITFLYVADLERSTRFYGQVLGLALVLDQGRCRVFQITDTSFVGVCTIRPERVGVAGALLSLVTNDVDEWHDNLVAAGATIVRPPEHSAVYEVYGFFAEDPDGNSIEVQRFDDPGWKLADG